MKKVVAAALLLCLAVLAVRALLYSAPAREVRVQTARRGPLEARYVANGRVTSRPIEVSAETFGRVREVRVKEAETVAKGQLLMVIEDSETDSRIAGLQAALDAARSYREESAYRLLIKQGQLESQRRGAAAKRGQADWQLASVRRGPSSQELARAAADLKESQIRVDQARKERVRAQQLFDEDFTARASVEKAVSAEKIALKGEERARLQLQELRAGTPREKIEVARAGVAVAQSELDGIERSALEVDLLAQQLRSKDLELARLQADLAAAKVKLAHNQLRATKKGVVSRLLRQAGEIVQAGTPVVQLLDSEKLGIEANVAEEDASFVSLDQPVKVRFPSIPGVSHEGQVTRLSPSLETLPGAAGNARYLVVQIGLKNAYKDIRPGLEAEVEGSRQLAQEALLIPRTALITQDGKHFVMILEGSRVRRLEVELGKTNAELAEIKKGLDSGQQVVTSEPSRLRDGESVSPKP